LLLGAAAALTAGSKHNRVLALNAVDACYAYALLAHAQYFLRDEKLGTLE
jgi:hypothetical protein